MPLWKRKKIQKPFASKEKKKQALVILNARDTQRGESSLYNTARPELIRAFLVHVWAAGGVGEARDETERFIKALRIAAPGQQVEKNPRLRNDEAAASARMGAAGIKKNASSSICPCRSESFSGPIPHVSAEQLNYRR